MANEAIADAGLVVPAPYATFGQLVAVLDWLSTASSAVALTEQTLESGPGLRGSVRTEVKNALAALGLIDAGLGPTPELLGLARARDERPQRWRHLLERCYPGPLEILESGAKRDEIRGAFAGCGRRGTTRDRAIGLFVAIAEAAGSPVAVGRSSASPPGHAAARNNRSAPTADQPGADERYAFALVMAVERSASTLDLSDPAVFERFEALCSRFERFRSG